MKVGHGSNWGKTNLVIQQKNFSRASPTCTTWQIVQKIALPYNPNTFHWRSTLYIVLLEKSKLLRCQWEPTRGHCWDPPTASAAVRSCSPATGMEGNTLAWWCEIRCRNQKNQTAKYAKTCLSRSTWSCRTSKTKTKETYILNICSWQ